MKEYIVSLIPPFLNAFYSKIAGKTTFWSGNFKDWQTALNKCNSYDDGSILNKVKDAALQVKAGKAIYERDAVLFYEPNYSWELIANLLKVAEEQDGKLCVLDFGGSLGSSYFQNKKYFQGIKNLTWCIVEQAHFVDFGKIHFEDEVLKFYHTIEEVMENHSPNVLLLLSVLPYLEQPKDWIEKFKNTKIDTILIDRTAFVEGDQDRITIQKVPASIYKASYPAWFFNEILFKTSFEKTYQLVAESSNNITNPIFLGFKKGYWKNFVFKRRYE